jgi:hypothetical protein
MNIKGKLYWFWKKLSERSQRGHYKEHYKAEIEYFESYKDKKSASTMKREMKILQKYWGCYPFQYIRYGMYKNSCTMSVEEMKDYIPNYFAYYLFFPKSIKCYGIVSEDKELSHRLFDSYGIAQPEMLFQYKHQLFYDHGKNSLNDDDIDKLIANSQAVKLFLKPTMGLGGQGIMVFNKKDRFVDKQGNELSADFVRQNLGKGEDYLLQEGLKQHDEINKIYANAVNTFRVKTKVVDGKAEVLLAMLRMGQGGNQLDNASLKGLVCKVDVDTGNFDNLGYTGLGKTMKAHPDSNFVFEGYTFPYWNVLKEFVLNATRKMETIGYIGWDIAYTVNGPVVIEMNSAPGLEYLQDCHGGVRTIFEIENPKKYWFSNNYAIKDL